MTTPTRKRKRKTPANSDFISWSELDLDSVLGEYTDMELHDGESGSDSDPGTIEPNKKAENVAKVAQSQSAKTNSVSDVGYSCPDCGKILKTITTFRGHMKKLHGRAELRATGCRVKAGTGKVTTSVLSVPSPPLTTSTEFSGVFQQCLTKTITDIRKDTMLNWPDSAHGAKMIAIADELSKHEDANVDFLKEGLASVFVTEKYFLDLDDAREDQRIKLHQCTTDKLFREQWNTHITGFGFDRASANQFLAVFTQHFWNSFVDLQLEAADAGQENVAPSATLDKEDNDIIAYICGYIVQRVRVKESCYCAGLAEVLGSRRIEDGVPTEWTACVDRGGLMYPTVTFYRFMQKCETVLRQCVNLDCLNADSLKRSQLKEDMLENHELQQLWDAIGNPANTLMREKVTDLYLTVRGHATAGRVMRQVNKEATALRLQNKGLRKSLKSKSSM